MKKITKTLLASLQKSYEMKPETPVVKEIRT
jgi:hypothetical protein